MLFKDIPGNKIVKKQLIQSARKKRIAHAQIFSGNKGNAKLALAISYARYINCLERLDDDSCQKCSSCVKYNKLSHPDLHFIFPVIKRNTKTKPISDYFIDSWRDFIRNNVYESLNRWINKIESESKIGENGAIYSEEILSIYKKAALKNFEANFKVFLIWMPERMALQTSGRLLKLLEEPPEKTVFLLVSEKTKQLLPTIKSRLQKIKVNSFTIEDALKYFNQENITEKKLKGLCIKTNYNFGKISQIIKEKKHPTELFELFSSWMRLAYRLDLVGISKWVDFIRAKGNKKQIELLYYAIKIIRECMIFNFSDKNLLIINQQEIDFISKFRSFVHEDNIVIIVEKLEKSISLINRNANAKILFFELSLQMTKLLKVERSVKIK